MLPLAVVLTNIRVAPIKSIVFRGTLIQPPIALPSAFLYSIATLVCTCFPSTFPQTCHYWINVYNLRKLVFALAGIKTISSTSVNKHPPSPPSQSSVSPKPKHISWCCGCSVLRLSEGRRQLAHARQSGP